MKNIKNYTICNENIHEYPLIINIPHSGNLIPCDIKDTLQSDTVLAGSDWFLNELYDFLKEMDITVMHNNLNRYVIDMNRKIERNNPLKFRNSLVFQETAYKSRVYKHDLSKKDIEERIRFYYQPYHESLDSLIKDKLKHFKKVYLLDLHSYYPEGSDKENIIISNQNNKTSSKEAFNLVCRTFRNENLKVTENELFLGGHITKFYGSRYKNKAECIQIELPYNIYLADREFGEEEVEIYDEKLFLTLKAKLQNIFTELLELI